MQEKEKELKEVYALLDEYSQSNKIVERLSEQLHKREEELNKK